MKNSNYVMSYSEVFCLADVACTPSQFLWTSFMLFNLALLGEVEVLLQEQQT